jgi:hypothetical protein
VLMKSSRTMINIIICDYKFLNVSIKGGVGDNVYIGVV